MWGDEKFGFLEVTDQLVYIGLISNADDMGRLVDSIRLLDGLIWPWQESRTCRESIANLSRAGLIQRGMTDAGQRVIQIVGWATHQRVDKPNLKASLPAIVKPCNDLGEPPESFANDSRKDPESFAPHTYDLRPTTSDQRPASVAHTREDDLSEWLGEHASAIDDNRLAVDPSVRSALFQQFGPPGLSAEAWRTDDGGSVPPDERPRLFASALTGYAAEGKTRIVANEFYGLVRKLVRTKTASDGLGGSGMLAEIARIEREARGA